MLQPPPFAGRKVGVVGDKSPRSLFGAQLQSHPFAAKLTLGKVDGVDVGSQIPVRPHERQDRLASLATVQEHDDSQQPVGSRSFQNCGHVGLGDDVDDLPGRVRDVNDLVFTVER